MPKAWTSCGRSTAGAQEAPIFVFSMISQVPRHHSGDDHHPAR
jgi:hypothetical protein